MSSTWWFWKRQYVLLGSPIAFLLGVFVATSNTVDPVPYWLGMTSRATLSIVFMAPVIAGLAAWQAGSDRAWNEIAVRGSLQLWGRCMLSAAAVALAGLAMTLTVLVTSTGVPAVGLPAGRVLASATLTCVGLAAFGYLLGRVAPRVPAATGAVVTSWLWLAYTPTTTVFWLRHVAGGDLSACCDLDSQLRPHSLTAPALVSVALIVGAALTSAWSRRRAAALAVAGLLFVISTGAAALLVRSFTADPVAARTGARVCSHATPVTVCLWPENRSRLDSVAKGVDTAMEGFRAAGVDVPARVLEDDTAPDRWTLSVRSDDPVAWAASLAMSQLNGLPPSCVDTPPHAWPAQDAYPATAAWLLLTAGVPRDRVVTTLGLDDDHAVPMRSATTVATRSQEDQSRWLGAALSALRGCDRTAPP